MKSGYFTPLAASAIVVASIAIFGFANPGIMPFQDNAASQMMANCPLHVEGTSIQVTEAANGVALTFTTTKGDIKDLRSRVQMMANMHNGGQGMMQHMQSMHGMKSEPNDTSAKSQEKGETKQQMGAHSGGQQMMNGGQHMGGMGMMHGRMGSKMSDQDGSHMMMLPTAEVTYETVPNGARLIFTPENKAESGTLLDRLTHYAEMMNGGTCTQLQMMNGMMSQANSDQCNTGMQQGSTNAEHHK